MPIYRGAGGAGDATADGASEALLIRELAIEVQADADAAADSATAAAGSASSASSSASAASTSASNAATSATNASNSASAASTSATNAANSATAAQTAKTAAELAETNAETAQAAAASSASAASSSASAASTSATNASNSATAAATSATNSANSATASATSATNSANSATAAAGSATTASTQATNAANSATAAASSATAAAGSATSASGSATTATTQAGIATTQATNASTSASNAATSATTATTQAGIATTQATNASNSATAAATSATNASNSASAASTSATNAANSATAAAASAASINPSSIAITGGSINGTTIGATTPSTGSFTSITDSGNLTFTGTGNRILGDFSNGTLPNRTAFQTTASNSATVVHFIPSGTATTSTLAIEGDSTLTNGSLLALVVGANSNTEARINSTIRGTGTYLPLTMYTGGSERLRIDTSGNVGIGTSSPAQRFVVSNAGAEGMEIIPAVNAGESRIQAYNRSGAAWNKFSINSGTFELFVNGGTSALFANTSGNVGIGTSSPGYKLQITNSTGIDTETGVTNSAGVSRYGTRGSGNAFAGSFTSGRSFELWSAGSQAAIIDSSGNVGIGTSSPARTLDVRGFVSSSDGTTRTEMVNGGGVGYIGTQSNHPLAIQTNNTERMRIDSSGIVSVGTTATVNDLNVPVQLNAASGFQRYFGVNRGGSYGLIVGYDYSSDIARIRNVANTAMTFETNNTERMRIDSSGSVLVGTTSVVASSGIGAKIYPTGTMRCVNADSTNSTENWSMYSTGAANYRFYVGWGGTIYATSATITSLSDQRLKENIVDLDDGLDAVMALKPRKFDWKTGKGKDIKGDRGFIAQEIETVFPDMIEESKDPVPEGEEPYKAVSANLIPTLVKAIQELKATVDAQAARIAALESN